MWKNYGIADDWSQTLTCLPVLPLEPRLRRQDTQDRRIKNVEEWLLQTEGFRNQDAGYGDVNPMTKLYPVMEIGGRQDLYSIIRASREECKEEGGLSADRPRLSRRRWGLIQYSTINSEDKMSPLRVLILASRLKGALTHAHASPPIQTGCRRVGRGPGGKPMGTRKRSLVGGGWLRAFCEETVIPLLRSKQ